VKGVGKSRQYFLPEPLSKQAWASWLRYGGNFCTQLFAHDLTPGSIFFPGTGEETMVLDGRNHKPLALLCLAFGVVVQT